MHIIQTSSEVHAMYTPNETPATVEARSSVVEERNSWVWGFTPQAEIWNGRLAMLGFIAALLTELYSGQGVLHFWGIM
jgi:hypothetical protein